MKNVRLALLGCAALAALALGACAHRPPDAPGAKATPEPGGLVERPPAVDSVTVALWRLDESTGLRCSDSGPYGMSATAGNDTRIEFGRFKNARRFIRSIESFVIARHNPVFESPNAFTVEAWVQPAAYSPYEVAVIAARWTPSANEQSWLLGVVGQRLRFPAVSPESPGTFASSIQGSGVGRLVFLMQPQQAAGERAWFSTSPIPLGQWTHVAASYDGEVIRLFVAGRLDAQFAIQGGIRPSPAPLLVGNFFDPRQLSDFSGTLRPEDGIVTAPWYAFDGVIDELRLSSAARVVFESSSAE